MRAASSSSPYQRRIESAMTPTVSRMLASRTAATSGSIAAAWSIASRLARVVSLFLALSSSPTCHRGLDRCGVVHRVEARAVRLVVLDHSVEPHVQLRAREAASRRELDEQLAP